MFREWVLKHTNPALCLYCVTDFPCYFNSKMLRYECQRYILYINFKNLTCLNVTANCPTQLMGIPGDTTHLQCQHGELSSDPHAKLSVCGSQHLWSQRSIVRVGGKGSSWNSLARKASWVSELWVQWRDTDGKYREALGTDLWFHVCAHAYSSSI